MGGLPSGEYQIGLLGTNDPDDLSRRALLDLSQGAPRLSLADGQTQKLDLVVPESRIEASLDGRLNQSMQQRFGSRSQK